MSEIGQQESERSNALHARRLDQEESADRTVLAYANTAHSINTGYGHVGSGHEHDTDACKDLDENKKKARVKEIEYFFDCNICLEDVYDPVVTRCGHLYCWPCLYKWLEPGFSLAERNHLHSMSKSTNMLNFKKDLDYKTANQRQNVSIQNINAVSNSHTNNIAHVNTIDPTRRSCPVCKAPCSLSSIVPIYVKSSLNSFARKNKSHHTERSGELQESAPRTETPNRPVPSILSQTSHTLLHNNISHDTGRNVRTDNGMSSSPPLLTSTTLSSSFDQSIVPILLGLRDISSQSEVSNVNIHSQSISLHSTSSTEEQREYTLMEDATTAFLSKILITMGSTVILILILF